MPYLIKLNSAITTYTFILKQIFRVVLIGDSLSKLTNEVKQSPQINEWGNVCRHLKFGVEVISDMTLLLRILLIGNQIFF